MKVANSPHYPFVVSQILSSNNIPKRSQTSLDVKIAVLFNFSNFCSMYYPTANNTLVRRR